MRPASQPERDLVLAGIGDQHAAVEGHAAAGFDQPRENKSEGQNQRDAVVRSPETDQGVCCECERDQASGHLQVGV